MHLGADAPPFADGKDVLPTDSPETIREKVETQVRRHSTDFEWHANGELSVTHRVPFIRTHHATGLPLCFGNLLSAYGRSKHHKALEPPFLGDDGGYHPLPLFGDGSAIETTSLERADRIVEETRILLKWQQGDVVLFDVSQHEQDDLQRPPLTSPCPRSPILPLEPRSAARADPLARREEGIGESVGWRIFPR